MKQGAITMQRSALSASADGRPEASDLVDADSAADTVVVHVQLRPRRGATRKCLAALAALAADHPSVSFAVTGLSKDDRVVRVTVGVDLGPRLGVARFSPQAQAAYAFVSALFTSLYDHMPVYAAEPSDAERAAAATLMDTVARPVAGPQPDVDRNCAEAVLADAAVPAPRPGGWSERVPA
jgi:hypothetical protein